MQNVQITQQILSASQLRLLAILEFSECLFCSLQFVGPISDSSDISLALTACRPRSACHLSLLSVCQACHTSCTELRFDCWKLFWSLAVIGLIQDSVHWCGYTICRVYNLSVSVVRGSHCSDICSGQLIVTFRLGQL